MKKPKGHRKMKIQIGRAKRRMDEFMKSRNLSEVEIQLKQRYEEVQKESNQENKTK